MMQRSKIIYAVTTPVSLGIAVVCGQNTRPPWAFLAVAFAISVLGELITEAKTKQSRKIMRQFASVFIFFALFGARMALAPENNTIWDAGLLVGIFLFGFAFTALLARAIKGAK